MKSRLTVTAPKGLLLRRITAHSELGLIEELSISPDNARLSAFQLEWLIKRHSPKPCGAVDKYYGVKGGNERKG
jgi:hypothetical protein